MNEFLELPIEEEEITREKLKQLEEEEGGNLINWTSWDRIVKEGREMIEKELQDPDLKQKRQDKIAYQEHCLPNQYNKNVPTRKRFVYSFRGNLKIEGYAWQIAEQLQMNPKQIGSLCDVYHIHHTRRLWFSNYLETPESIRKQIKDKLKRTHRKK